jgi:hypothetical protein
MRTLIIFALIFLTNIPCIAQWTKLGEWPKSSIYATHFLDYVGKPEVGFISLGQFPNIGLILRTTDAGKTWKQVALSDHILTNFTFKDSLVGWTGGSGAWSASRGCYGVIYVTSDGGENWKLVDSSCIADIHYDKYSNRVYTAGDAQDGLTTSTDDGVSWQTLSNKQFSTVASNQKGAFVASGWPEPPRSSPFLYSTNGLSWFPSNVFGGTSQLALKGGEFFSILFWGSNGHRVIKSADGGRNWTEVTQLVGDLEGNSGVLGANTCYLYTQTFQNFYRSSDDGLTWQVLGNMGNSPGTRFYTMQNVVYVPKQTTSNVVELWQYVEPTQLIVPNKIDLLGCKEDTTILLKYLSECFEGVLLEARVISPTNRFTLGSMSLPQSVSGEFAIPLHYSSSVPGATDNASLKIRFRAGAYTFDTVIAITANSGAGASKVGFELRPTNTSPKPGELTTIGVYPTAATTSAELTDLSFDLSYYDDLFALKSVRSASGVNFTPSVVSGKQTAAITLSSPDIKLDPNTSVAEIDLEARLTDTVSSDVTISNIKLNNGDADYARCKLSLDESNGTALSVTLACGDPLIQRVIRGERAIAIKSIAPNPTNGKLTIDYESKLSGEVMLSVYSVNGVVMHEEAIHSSGKPIKLDTSGWPSGAYTIVLRSGDDEARGSVIKE